MTQQVILETNLRAHREGKSRDSCSNIKIDAERGTAEVMRWWTFYATVILGRLAFGKSPDVPEQEEVRSNLLESDDGH